MIFISSGVTSWFAVILLLFRFPGKHQWLLPSSTWSLSSLGYVLLRFTAAQQRSEEAQFSQTWETTGFRGTTHCCLDCICPVLPLDWEEVITSERLTRLFGQYYLITLQISLSSCRYVAHFFWICLKFLSNGNTVFSFLDIEEVFVEEKITINMDETMYLQVHRLSTVCCSRNY